MTNKKALTIAKSVVEDFALIEDEFHKEKDGLRAVFLTSKDMKALTQAVKIAEGK